MVDETTVPINLVSPVATLQRRCQTIEGKPPRIVVYDGATYLRPAEWDGSDAINYYLVTSALIIDQLPAIFDGSASEWPADYREQFWQTYPRRVGKASAIRKLEAVCKSRKVPWSTFYAAVVAFALSCKSKEMQYIAHPTTWLHQGRWDDDPEGNNLGGGAPAPRNGYLDMLGGISGGRK